MIPGGDPGAREAGLWVWGPWGPEGRSAGPTSPNCPPTLVYCTRLAMAFSLAPPLVWSSLEAERSTVLLVRPFHPMPGCSLMVLNREAHFQETEDRLAYGWAQGTHKAGGFRKYFRANSSML